MTVEEYGMNGIKVAILMTTYNGEKYISDQIESIINQTFKDWVLLISDDQSSDSSVSLVEEYVIKYPEKIKRIISGKKFGNAKDHFMWLANHVKLEYKYYMFCDQDDIWHPDKIEKSINKLIEIESNEPDIPCLVFTDLTSVDINENVVAESVMDYVGFSKKNLFFDYHFQILSPTVWGCTFAFNGSLLKKAVDIPNYNEIKMHDYWFAIVSALFGRLYFLDSPTIDYRQHGNNTSGTLRNIHKWTYIFSRIPHVKNHYIDLQNSKKTINKILDCYHEFLTSEQIAFLHDFSKKHSGIVFWLKNRKYTMNFKRFVVRLFLA